MSLRERRAAKATTEIRKQADEEKSLTFTGHAAIFNERTWIGPKKWGFWETVDPGFFRDVLEDDAAFLVNHDPNIVLARNPTTMSLSTDKRGLVADADWDPADPDATKWAGRVRRGDVNQMSFAFTVQEDKWDEDSETGEETRTLLTAERLYDASLVTYPAYEGTDGGMRDSTAEVVRRHRGYDPRVERQAPVVVDLGAGGVTTGTALNLNGMTTTASTTGLVFPPVTVTPAEAPDERSVTYQMELLQMRHRLMAARLGLPV